MQTASKLQTLLQCSQDRFELAQKKKEEQERQKKMEAEELERKNQRDMFALFGTYGGSSNVYDDSDGLDTSFLDRLVMK